MLAQMLERRDTAANWSSANTVLGSGELGLDTTNNIIKIGDGATAWNSLTVTLVVAGSTQTLTNKTLTSPTLTTPALGTPASGTLTNCTGLPVAGGGTGVATIPANNVVVGNGTSAVTGVAPGTAKQLLQSNGTVWASAAVTREAVNESVNVSSAASLTLATTTSHYVFSGVSAATWTLPAVAGSTGFHLILENRGSAAVTVNAAGADHIWWISSLTAMTMAIGGSLHLVNDGTFWNALSTDLANNSVGLLPVSNGGTGAATLTGLVKGNGTSAMTAVTAPAGTVVGTSDTQTLTNKTLTGYTETVQALGTIGATVTLPSVASGTLLWGTLTTATACTITLPTAGAGLSFLLALRQPATGTAVAVTWAASPVVKWPAAGAPVITATVAKADLLSFICYDGTNWYGSYVQGYTY